MRHMYSSDQSRAKPSSTKKRITFIGACVSSVLIILASSTVLSLVIMSRSLEGGPLFDETCRNDIVRCLNATLTITIEFLKSAFDAHPKFNSSSSFANRRVTDGGEYTANQVDANIYIDRSNLTVVAPVVTDKAVEELPIDTPVNKSPTASIPEVIDISGLNYVRESLTQITNRNLYTSASYSCTDVNIKSNKWNYIRRGDGLVVPIRCDLVPECGPGLWNRVFSLKEGLGDATKGGQLREELYCPVGMIDEESCSITSEFPSKCVTRELEVPLRGGYREVCGRLLTRSKGNSSLSTSYVTVATRNKLRMSGNILVYSENIQTNDNCSCFESIDREVELLLDNTRHREHFGSIGASLSVQCRITGGGESISEKCKKYVREYFRHSIAFTSHSPIYIGICSSLTEPAVSDHEFVLDVLNVYVR